MRCSTMHKSVETKEYKIVHILTGYISQVRKHLSVR